jgi:hypothetical protein
MAELVATFAAQFDAFTAACAKAEGSLKSISSGADTAAARLVKMQDSLSGTKIIQQATLMAEAVERVGGVSTLTAKELAKVGAVATEAAAKLRALGQDVPASIQKIADAAKQGASSFETFLGSVTKLAAGLGLAFSAQALLSGAKELIGGAIDMASAIDDASRKLGVSAEKFQGWVAAAKLAGASSEDVSTAVGKMNSNLDGGSKSTVDALKQAGLSFQAVRAMKPEDAFDTIADAIAKIPDPMTQARVAVELFGKGGQTLLPAIKDHFLDVAGAADKMSNDTVARLDAAGDAIEKFKNRATIAVGETIAALIGNNGLNDALKILDQTQRDAVILQLPKGSTIEQANAALIAAAKAHHDVNLAAEPAAAAIHKTQEELAAEAAAARKAADAADALAKKIKEIGDKASGAKVAEDLRQWSVALQALSASGQGLTMTGFTDLIKLINEAKAAGVPLTAQLEEMWVAYTRLHSPIAALAVPLGQLLKAFPDLSGGMKESERGAADLSKGIDAFGRSLDKIKVPLALPQLKLHLDAATAATLAVDLAQVKLDKTITDAIRLMVSHNMTVEQAVAHLLQYNSITKDQAAAILAQAKNVQTLDQTLSSLAGAFQTVAQVSGGTFSGITKAVGTGVADINLVSKSFDALKKAQTAWDQEATHTTESFANLAVSAASAAASVIGLFFAGVSLAKSLIDAANAARIMREQLGLADDASKKFLITTQPMGDITVGELGGDVYVAFSDQLVASMERSRQALEGFYQLKAGSPALINFYAEALNLAGIIRELGGVSDKNLGHVEELMAGLFDVIKMGGPTAGQAVNALNDAFKEMSGYLSEDGRLWDTTIQAAITKSKELGLNLAAVNDLMAKQQGNIAKAIEGVTGKLGGEAKTMIDLKAKVTDAQKAYDDLAASGTASAEDLAAAAKDVETAQAAVGHATVTTQAEFDRLNRIALATFNTLVASGKSPVEAMNAIGGSIDDLIDGAKAFGLGGSQAFDTLSRWRDLTKNNAPLLTEISSLNGLMTATANIGGLTADGFADLQAQGVAAYDQLTAAGFSQQEAEQTMVPTLQTILKLHKDKGLAIDEATQKIIDQATQDGILGAQEESTNDVLREGLGALITVLGGDLPAAWQKAADAGTTAAGTITGKDGLDKVSKELGIQQKALSDDKAWQDLQKNAAAASGDVTNSIKKIPTTVNVGVNYTTNGSPGGPPAGPPAGPGGAATASRGGLVTTTGISYLAGGGAVWPWMPKGTDTVPAMLTPGERVLSVADARAYDARRGGSYQPQATTIVIQALDSQSVAAWLRQGTNARTLAEGVVPHVPAVVRRYGLDR